MDVLKLLGWCHFLEFIFIPIDSGHFKWVCVSQAVFTYFPEYTCSQSFRFPSIFTTVLSDIFAHLYHGLLLVRMNLSCFTNSVYMMLWLLIWNKVNFIFKLIVKVSDYWIPFYVRNLQQIGKIYGLRIVLVFNACTIDRVEGNLFIKFGKVPVFKFFWFDWKPSYRLEPWFSGAFNTFT